MYIFLNLKCPWLHRIQDMGCPRNIVDILDLESMILTEFI